MWKRKEEIKYKCENKCEKEKRGKKETKQKGIEKNNKRSENTNMYIICLCVGGFWSSYQQLCIQF